MTEDRKRQVLEWCKNLPRFNGVYESSDLTVEQLALKAVEWADNNPLEESQERVTISKSEMKRRSTLEPKFLINELNRLDEEFRAYRKKNNEALKEAAELFKKVLSFCLEEDIRHYTQAVIFFDAAEDWLEKYDQEPTELSMYPDRL